MKAKKKNSSGSVKVDPTVLEEAKTICKNNGIMVSFYATEAIKEKNKKEKTK
jgi:post-segregation antitoxin (ccd killing protein)